MNQAFFVIVGILVLLYVTHVVRRNKLPIKESFWWFIGAVAVLLLAIFPQVLDWTATLLGISYPPALLLTLCSIFLLLINFKDGRRIANLQIRNIELEQQIVLLKNRLDRLNQKDKTSDRKD